MANLNEEIIKLSEEFSNCGKLLQALGDENRQKIILQMMQIGRCGGVQVSEITEKNPLSRPAVSHHFQVLRDAGILKMRRDGAKRFYCFDLLSTHKLLLMLKHAIDIVEQLPEQNVR